MLIDCDLRKPSLHKKNKISNLVDLLDVLIGKEDLKTKFDYIVLDTQTIQAVTDSQILATKADGTILVVKSRKNKKS